MSKASAIVSLSPLKFVPGSIVLADDLVDVIKASNYAAANCPEIHGAQCPAMVQPPPPPGWVDATHPLWTPFVNAIYADRPGEGWSVRLDWWFRLDQDCRILRFYAQCAVPVAGEEIDVKLTIDGVDQGTLAFLHTDVNAKNFPIDTTTGGGSIDAGERHATISIQSTIGSHAYDGTVELVNVAYLKWWSLQEDTIDSLDFPSPTEDILIIEG